MSFKISKKKFISKVENTGSGANVGKQVGESLVLKTIKGGINAVVIDSSDTITINSSGVVIVNNVGGGTELGSFVPSNTLKLKTLIAGTDITFVDSSTNITINATSSGASQITGSVTTTNTTPTTLITISTVSNSLYNLDISVNGANTTLNNGNIFFLKGGYKNISGTLTKLTSIEDELFIREDVGTNLNLNISGTSIIIEVVGLSATTIKWSGVVVLQTLLFKKKYIFKNIFYKFCPTILNNDSSDLSNQNIFLSRHIMCVPAMNFVKLQLVEVAKVYLRFKAKVSIPSESKEFK